MLKLFLMHSKGLFRRHQYHVLRCVPFIFTFSFHFFFGSQWGQPECLGWWVSAKDDPPSPVDKACTAWRRCSASSGRLRWAGALIYGPRSTVLTEPEFFWQPTAGGLRHKPLFVIRQRTSVTGQAPWVTREPQPLHCQPPSVNLHTIGLPPAARQRGPSYAAGGRPSATRSLREAQWGFPVTARPVHSVRRVP